MVATSAPSAEAGALLHFRIPSVEVASYDNVQVVRSEPDGALVDVPSTVHEEPCVVTAMVDRLGTYALVARPAIVQGPPNCQPDGRSALIDALSADVPVPMSQYIEPDWP